MGIAINQTIAPDSDYVDTVSVQCFQIAVTLEFPRGDGTKNEMR